MTNFAELGGRGNERTNTARIVRGRTWKTLAGSVLLALLAAPAGLRAAPVVDQQQAVIDTSVGGLVIGGGSRQKLAQVVTAGLSGLLVEVRLPVACASGNLIVEIQGVADGTPNGVVLTSQSFAGPFSGATFTSIAFSTPVFFNAGDRFAFVLTSAGACGIFQGPVGDSCPGGNAFFDSRPNAPGVWVCICDFAGSRFDLPFQTLVDTLMPVSIDIKPGSNKNPINRKSRGNIPVAILSSPTFDAPGQVDQLSLTFGRSGDEASLLSCNPNGEDVNGDGLKDQVCHFGTPLTGFQPGDAVGVLKGKTVHGIPIEGTDAVRIVGTAASRRGSWRHR